MTGQLFCLSFPCRAAVLLPGAIFSFSLSLSYFPFRLAAVFSNRLSSLARSPTSTHLAIVHVLHQEEEGAISESKREQEGCQTEGTRVIRRELKADAAKKSSKLVAAECAARQKEREREEKGGEEASCSFLSFWATTTIGSQTGEEEEEAVEKCSSNGEKGGEKLEALCACGYTHAVSQCQT